MVRKTQIGSKTVVHTETSAVGKHRRATQSLQSLRNGKKVIKKAVQPVYPTPDFSPEITNLSGHYYLNDNADIKRFCTDYSAMHHYREPLKYRTTNIPGLVAMEKKFKIAPVAALGNPETSDKVFGIFATRAIWVPPHVRMPIDRYLGKKVEAGKESQQSSFVMEVSNPDMVIDAGPERNWIPMINAALSQEAANVSII